MSNDERFITCINASIFGFNLSVGTTYQVESETEDKYIIIDDGDREYSYPKGLFIPSIKPKEIPIGQYTFKELITDISPGDEYNYEGIKVRCLQDGAIEIQGTNGGLFKFSKSNLFEKSKVKPIATCMAFQALAEGKIIESSLTGTKYYQEHYGLMMKRKADVDYLICNSIAAKEIASLWYTKGDEHERN